MSCAICAGSRSRTSRREIARRADLEWKGLCAKRRCLTLRKQQCASTAECLLEGLRRSARRGVSRSRNRERAAEALPRERAPFHGARQQTARQRRSASQRIQRRAGWVTGAFAANSAERVRVGSRKSTPSSSQRYAFKRKSS